MNTICLLYHKYVSRRSCFYIFSLFQHVANIVTIHLNALCAIDLLQPEEVGIMSHDNVVPESLSTRVSLEMFDSIIHEVVEETGIPAISLVC